jgi:Replication-relaxation
VAGPLTRRRPAGRPPAGFASQLASRLTERDRRIALDCYDHRLLNTEQLRRLHFATLRVAQRRLAELHELRVLERFRPAWQRGEGSTPYHWLLDHAGALIVAELLDLPVEQLAWRRDHTLAIATSSKRQHQLAVNELFTRLAADARARGGSLREWWGERRTAAAFAGHLQPDGYGHLQLDNHSSRFLLELDRGTETHARLVEKAARYQRELPRSELAALQPAVLLLTPSKERTATAADALAGSDIQTATWTPESTRSPLDLVLALSRSVPTRP